LFLYGLFTGTTDPESQEVTNARILTSLSLASWREILKTRFLQPETFTTLTKRNAQANIQTTWIQRNGHNTAVVHRAAFNDRLPWLAGLHTPTEDRTYFREQVFQKYEIWGALDNARLIGIIAFREDWIDHLYVLPNVQGQGVGTALLHIS